MADEKKISDLSNIQNNGDGGIKDEDVFVVVDSSITTGVDAGADGKTSAISFGDLKTAVGTQGQKGDKGEEGAPGIPGAPGDKGQAGSNGTNGTNGDKGQKGQAGSNGTNGNNGDKGQKGQAGSNGTNGNNGDKGQKGQAGSNGTNGTNGTRGDKGQKGDGGAKGSTGSSGSPWGGGTFTGHVYYNKPTYFFKENENGVYWGLRKATSKNLVIDVTNSNGIISASGTQTAIDTHRLEIDTTVQVNAGILAIAAKPAQGEQNRLSMNQTQWNTFRQQGIEGGQLILGYSGKDNATAQVGTWNIDSAPIDFDQKHRDTLRFFSYDLNNKVSIPMAIAPYGVAITDYGTSNDDGSWDQANNRVLPQAALKVQGNGVYQIEFESRNETVTPGHAKLGERCKGGIGIDTNGFMRICGDGDETVVDADGNGGHYSGVAIMAYTKEIARFEQHGIKFHVPVEYKATSGNGTSSDGIKTLQGWVGDAIVVDDTAILMEQANQAGTNRHRISAWNINTGLFEGHINPNADAGFSGEHPGSTSVDSDDQPDLIMAETHLHDGTPKNKEEIAFYAYTIHASDYHIRHTYNRITKEITGINYIGTQRSYSGEVAFSGHWKPFATYASQEFDNNANRMLVCIDGTHSTLGKDEYIGIYSVGLTGENSTTYDREARRGLNIRDLDGFDDVLFWPGSTETNVNAYASVVSINPWNGRVYIVTGGESNAFHTFQINPDQKVSGKSWVETFWDGCEADSSTSDGYAYGDGHLQYVSSWKAPLQDTIRNRTTGANGDLRYSISYDYDTEKPKYIAHCSKHQESFPTYSGHSVQFIPFSEDWM